MSAPTTTVINRLVGGLLGNRRRSRLDAGDSLGNEALVADKRRNTSKHDLSIDKLELDRLINMHYLLKHCFGNNFSAPVHDLLLFPSVCLLEGNDAPVSSSSTPPPQTPSSPQSANHRKSVSTCSSSKRKSMHTTVPPRVLDIACGPGTWLLEMATEFPNAQFYGIDIAAVFPTAIKPPNSHFMQDDVVKGLVFPDEHFDFVYMGMVDHRFSREDRHVIMQEILRVLKPGGYVEFRDVDPALQNGGPISRHFIFSSRFRQTISERSHVDTDTDWARQMCGLLQQTSMTDINEKVVSVSFQHPLLAEAVELDANGLFDGCKRFFIAENRILTQDDYESMKKAFLTEAKERGSYFNYYMTWARKPLVDHDQNSRRFSIPLSSKRPSSLFMDEVSEQLRRQREQENDIVQFSAGFTE